MPEGIVGVDPAAAYSGYEDLSDCLERDARRYNRAFGEEEEAMRV